LDKNFTEYTKCKCCASTYKWRTNANLFDLFIKGWLSVEHSFRCVIRFFRN